MAFLVATGASALADTKAPAAPSLNDELSQRLVAIVSRSAHASADVPKFAFTGNLSLEQPANWGEATMGFPDNALADTGKTLVVQTDPDTAVISTHLAEYASCPAAGCARAGEADSRLRAVAVFEKANGNWQPVAWAITHGIVSAAQQDAMEQGIMPDKIGRNTAGADEVAKQFETTAADPKAFAASFSDRKEVVMFGSELPERYVGAKAKAQITSWNLAFKVRDGLRAGISKSGNLVWVAANVDATSVKNAKAKPIPFRMFTVYEKSAAGWKVVEVQFSTAV
jgi:hypothetical protein